VTAEKPPPTPAWNPYDRHCPSRLAIDHIADRWTILILGRLGDGPLRFNALLRAIDGVTQKVLSRTLKRLERDGIVTRTVFATNPVTVEYTITALGLDLAEAVKPLCDWALINTLAVLAAQAAYDKRIGDEPVEVPRFSVKV
jgi:DNA-binding HxlR family transcriptional regulator